MSGPESWGHGYATMWRGDINDASGECANRIPGELFVEWGTVSKPGRVEPRMEVRFVPDEPTEHLHFFATEGGYLRPVWVSDTNPEVRVDFAAALSKDPS